MLSIKQNKTYPKYSIDLGDELHNLLTNKYVKMTKEIKPQVEETLKQFNAGK